MHIMIKIMQDEFLIINEKLKALGVKHQDFCREVGIHPSTWQRWRNGEILPNLRNWQKVQSYMRKIRS